MGTVTSITSKQTSLPKVLTVTLLLISRSLKDQEDGQRGVNWGAGGAGAYGRGEPAEGGVRPAEGRQGASLNHPPEEKPQATTFTDKKTLSEEEEKLKQMFADKKDLNFHDFLKWKMQSNTSVAPMAEILQALFEEVDDGDGYLTPDELIK